MPRIPRQKSCSGFTHVIVRGIGKQILFEDKSDYLSFISILKNNAENSSVTICAFCLMDNHVHLLLFDKQNEIPLFMKKIGISYAIHYNQKYQRSGHVFQDRYKSELIESDRYLLTVFRYILKNPVKAGICSAADYQWSSYACYGRTDTFVDTRFLSELIGDYKQYETFIGTDDNDKCMEFSPVRLTDNEAIEILKKMGFESGTLLQTFTKKDRNHAISKLLHEGLSIRQIERLTGISRGVIQRVKDSET